MCSLQRRAGGADLRSDLVHVRLKVVGKGVDQLAGMLVVRFRVIPRLAGRQESGRSAGDLGGNGEPKDRVLGAGSVTQGVVEDRVHHGPRVVQCNAVSLSVGPARHARVHEPAVGVVPMNFLAEELGVHRWIAYHKRLAKAGAEGGLWFVYPCLGAGDLGRVAAQEVIHRLCGGELRDWGQHAERVVRQKENVVGMPALAVRGGVGDAVEGIRAACVLGDRVVRKVRLAGVGVHDHILQDGPELLRRAVDFGLTFRGDIDHLCVAAALEVVDAPVAPAVLVVPDERAARIGREGRLAGAAQAKEDRRVPVLALVRRAVHGQYALLGEHVVEDREDGLLDLAAVVGAADQDQILGDVDEDGGLGVGPVPLRVGLELAEVHHGKARLERVGHRAVGPHEHVAGEQAVPRLFGDDADRKAVRFIPAGMEVLHEKVAPLGVLGHPFVKMIERGPVRGLVHLAPVDLVGHRRVPDDEPVFRAPARVRGRAGHERAARGELSLVAIEGLFVEAGSLQVVVHRGGGELEGTEVRRHVVGEGHRGIELVREVHARSASPGGTGRRRDGFWKRFRIGQHLS